MIATCQHCHEHFWRYRRDHPPAGFCSVPHAEAGPRKAKATPPPKPATVLLEWREHRIEIHDEPYFLQDFNCDTCEEFADRYACSLAYWVDHPEYSPEAIAYGSGA